MMKSKLGLKVFSVALSVLIIAMIIPAGTVFADAVGVYVYDYESASTLEGWSYYGDKHQLSTTRVHGGETSLELNTDVQYTQIEAPLNHGNVCGQWHTLVVDFWIYFDSAFDLSQLTSNLRVYTYAANSWCNTPNSAKGADIGVNENFLGHWTHVSVTFHNSSSNMYPYLYLMQSNAVGAFGGKVYIDDVTVTTLSYGTYSGGSAQTLKDLHSDYANSDLIVPTVTGGTIPTPTRSGFAFDGWYTESTYENKVTTYLAGNNSYYAKWRGLPWDGTVATGFDGGTGTSTNPYQIATPAQLAYLCGMTYGNGAGEYFALTEDICINDTSLSNWKSSARGWYNTTLEYYEYNFRGTFDGDNHIISGLYINNSGNDRAAGLFPSIRDTVTIKNLGIIDSSITMAGTGTYAGAIAGATDGSFTITNCFVAPSVYVSATHTAAGIIGRVDNASSAQTANVENVYSLAKLNGTNNYALFGYMWRNYTGTVTNVYTVGYDLFANNDNRGSLLTATNDYSSVKVLSWHTHTVVSRENMLGDTAQSYMTGFDYTDVWATADGKYPYLKSFGLDYAYGFCFRSHSISLSDSIGVNFFVDLSGIYDGEIDGSYMTFAITNADNKTVLIDSGFKNEAGKYYGFACVLNSVQMAETITPTFHYGDGLTLVGSTYSLKDYIDYVNAHTGEFDQSVIELVNAIGNYGYHAQQYFSGKTVTSLNASYSTAYTPLSYSSKKTAVEDHALTAAGIENGGNIGQFRYALNLDSTISILLKFNTGEVTFDSVLKGGNDYANRKNAYTENDCMLYLLHLPISQLGDKIIVTGTADGNSYSMQVSGLTYVYGVLDKDGASTALKNLVCALSDYYTAAVTYVNRVSSSGYLNTEFY